MAKASDLTGVVVRPSSVGAGAQADLDRIFDVAATRTPFLSLDFCRSVEESGGDVEVLIIERDGRTVGYFAFQFANRIDRLLRHGQRVGLHLADYCGPVLLPDCQIREAQLLRLAQLSSFGFSHLMDLSDRGPSADFRDRGALIDLQAGAAEYWGDLTRREKPFVADMLRLRRQLVAKHGEIDFFYEDREMEDFSRLLQTKRQQYRDTGVPDPLQATWTRDFLQEIWANPRPRARGVLSTLYAGNTWVASHLGIRTNNTMHYWFPVYNSEVSRYAPGRLLLKELIDNLGEYGIDMIDMGEGLSKFKEKFASREYALGRGLWANRSVRALVSQVREAVAWRLDQRRQAKQQEAGA